MKIKIFAVCLFLVAENIFAQGGMSFGVGAKGGVNIAFFADNFSSGTSTVVANAGAIGVMNFGKNGNSALVAELLFNQKGGTNKASGQNQISNFDLPILYRYSTSIKQEFPMKLFFNAGPYFGVVLARKTTSTEANYAKDFKSNFLEMGLCGGLGATYPIGPGNVFLEFRYGFSITNIVPLSSERNQVSSISLGYIYNFQAASQEDKDKKIQGGFE